MKFRRSAPVAVTCSTSVPTPSFLASANSTGTPKEEIQFRSGSFSVSSVHSVPPTPAATPGRRQSEPAVPPSQDAVLKYYKQRTSLDQRRQEVQDIQMKFPGKVMIILERYRKEKQLPAMDRIKFLVPRDITLSQFVTIIRNRMKLQRSQAIYFLIDDRAIASMATTMSELHTLYSDPDDGFMYLKYASQETFG